MTKKFLCSLLIVIMFMFSASYGAGMKPDIDLTKLSGVMAYSGLFNVMCNPPEYEGKIIKVQGYCDSVHDDETGKDYYGVIIMDGSACCSLGVDFILKNGAKYPEIGSVITVTGRFEQYKDGEEVFCRLADAELM